MMVSSEVNLKLGKAWTVTVTESVLLVLPASQMKEGCYNQQQCMLQYMQ